MAKFNFDIMYGQQETVKKCLERIVRSMSCPKKREDIIYRKKILKKNVEDLTPDDFVFIWSWADPFSDVLDQDPHPRNDPSYKGVWVNVIREISRVVVVRLADHALEENPVWTSYLAHTRWKKAIGVILDTSLQEVS